MEGAMRILREPAKDQTFTGLQCKFKGDKHSTTLVDTALGMGVGNHLLILTG